MTIETRACWQPWDSANVAADGKVYPCCVVDARLEIGDLNSSFLEQIVSGTTARTLKAKLLSGDINDLPCKECCNAPMMRTAEFRQAVSDRFFAPPQPVETPVAAAKAAIKEPITLKSWVKQHLIRLVERF